MATTATKSETDPKVSASPRVEPIDRRSLNWPNFVTTSRLVLAIVLFVMIDYGFRPFLTAGMFAFAVMTDALDGYLARKYGQITTLGRILDPFVDKFIVGGTFFFLLGNPDSGVNPWMVTIVIGREMFISTLRGFLEQQGIDFSANWAGKAKMVLQCVAVTGALMSLNEDLQESARFLLLRDALLWLAVVVTAWSGIAYIWRAFVVLRDRAAQDTA